MPELLHPPLTQGVKIIWVQIFILMFPLFCKETSNWLQHGKCSVNVMVADKKRSPSINYDSFSKVHKIDEIHVFHTCRLLTPVSSYQLTGYSVQWNKIMKNSWPCGSAFLTNSDSAYLDKRWQLLYKVCTNLSLWPRGHFWRSSCTPSQTICHFTTSYIY